MSDWLCLKPLNYPSAGKALWTVAPVIISSNKEYQLMNINDAITCELCKKTISQEEAKEAESLLSNAGMPLCLECVNKTLHPKNAG